MKTTLIKAWITKAGLPARVVLTHGTHHCGYVGVAPGHSLFGKYYDAPSGRPLSPDTPIGDRGIMALVCADLDNPRLVDMFDVHGSLTFAGPLSPALLGDGLHWFGFDCTHYNDALLDPETGQIVSMWPGMRFWTAEDVEAECESLAQQITKLYPQ